MTELSGVQEEILKFLDFWTTASKEFLLKSGFTKHDLKSLRESGYIEIIGDSKMVFLQQEGTDYISKLLKE